MRLSCIRIIPYINCIYMSSTFNTIYLCIIDRLPTSALFAGNFIVFHAIRMVTVPQWHNAAIRHPFTATIMLMRLCFLRERHREAAKQEQSSQHKYH